VKVLIAEENANCREALAGFFRGHASVVCAVADGDKARACLQSDSFDAVIVHLNLPRGGASEVAQAALAQNPEVVLIVVTAFGNGFRPVLQAPRMNGFLVQKPYRAGQLLRLIEDAGALRPKMDPPVDMIDKGYPVVQYAHHRSGDNTKD